MEDAQEATARFIAALPNGPADTSSFDVSLPGTLLQLVSGDGQSATVSTTLPQPLSFRVLASDSVPVAGVPVTFAVTTGGGTLGAAADTSDATGVVSSTWTLGALAGAQTVTATVTGVPASARVVTATGLTSVATQLVIVSAPYGTAAPARATRLVVPATGPIRRSNHCTAPATARRSAAGDALLAASNVASRARSLGDRSMWAWLLQPKPWQATINVLFGQGKVTPVPVLPVGPVIGPADRCASSPVPGCGRRETVESANLISRR